MGMLVLFLLVMWFIGSMTSAAFCLSLVSWTQGAKYRVTESIWLGVAGFVLAILSYAFDSLHFALIFVAFLLSVIGCRSVGSYHMQFGSNHVSRDLHTDAVLPSYESGDASTRKMFSALGIVGIGILVLLLTGVLSLLNLWL